MIEANLDNEERPFVSVFVVVVKSEGSCYSVTRKGSWKGSFLLTIFCCIEENNIVFGLFCSPLYFRSF